MAKDSTEKLNTIVDDLLDLAKFAKGKLRMNFEADYLDELVRRAVEKYGPALAGAADPADAALPQTACASLADPNRVNQVLNNLLTNAVKFTPEGGEVTLELRATSALPGFVALSCWNSGEPIADENLERIFDRSSRPAPRPTAPCAAPAWGWPSAATSSRPTAAASGASPRPRACASSLVLPVEPPPGAAARRTPRELRYRRRKLGPRAARCSSSRASRSSAYIIKALLLGARLRGAPRPHRRGGHPGRAAPPPGRHPRRRAPARRGRPAPGGDPPARSGHPAHAAAGHLRRSTSAQRAFRAGRGRLPAPAAQVDKLLGHAWTRWCAGAAGQQHGRVLVVDDDAKIGAICSEVLASLGFEVTVAGSLEEAPQGPARAPPGRRSCWT